MMAYYNCYYWTSGLCLLSGIPEKNTFQKLNISILLSFLHVGRKTHGFQYIMLYSEYQMFTKYNFRKVPPTTTWNRHIRTLQQSYYER